MSANRLPDLQCACANLRRAARLVTQLYAGEMGDQPEPAQFALLTAIAGNPESSQAQLGQALGLDKTTLSRNLALLRRNRWVRAGECGPRLTSAGERILSAAQPAWLRAQAKLQSAMKPGEWDALMSLSCRAAEAAAQAHGAS